MAHMEKQTKHISNSDEYRRKSGAYDRRSRFHILRCHICPQMSAANQWKVVDVLGSSLAIVVLTCRPQRLDLRVLLPANLLLSP